MAKENTNAGATLKGKDGETVAVVFKESMPEGFGEPKITRPEFLYTSKNGGTIVARLALPVGSELQLDCAVWRSSKGIRIALPQYVTVKSDDVLIALDKAMRERLTVWAKTAPPMPTETRGNGTAATTAGDIAGL